MNRIRIGSRGSKLARWQAEWVAAELSKQGVATEIVFLKTLGDVRSGPIGNVGAQGVFTKEIQRALLDNQVDIAVHSLKDLPTAQTPGLLLAAFPTREKCGDALLARQDLKLDQLPKNAVIATGSARRKAQLLAYRGDFVVRDVRGNVDSRLAKLNDGEFDALVLAEAGLRRLGFADRIREVLAKSVMLPAPGQGALGLEVRASDQRVGQTVGKLDDPETRSAVSAERTMLESLRGGCLAPVGAWARFEQESLRLDGIVLNADGSQSVTVSVVGTSTQCKQLGLEAAEILRADGADELLDSSRR